MAQLVAKVEAAQLVLSCVDHHAQGETIKHRLRQHLFSLQRSARTVCEEAHRTDIMCVEALESFVHRMDEIVNTPCDGEKLQLLKATVEDASTDTLKAEVARHGAPYTSVGDLCRAAHLLVVEIPETASVRRPKSTWPTVSFHTEAMAMEFGVEMSSPLVPDSGPYNRSLIERVLISKVARQPSGFPPSASR